MYTLQLVVIYFLSFSIIDLYNSFNKQRYGKKPLENCCSWWCCCCCELYFQIISVKNIKPKRASARHAHERETEKNVPNTPKIHIKRESKRKKNMRGSQLHE